MVEHNLAKVGVASSSLVFRSKPRGSKNRSSFLLSGELCVDRPARRSLEFKNDIRIALPDFAGDPFVHRGGGWGRVVKKNKKTHRKHPCYGVFAV